MNKEHGNRFLDVAIRDVEMADIPIFFVQQLDPEANRMAAFVRANPQDRTAFDAHWKRIMGEIGIIDKAIFQGKEVAGHVSCYSREEELEITYWLGKEHWGRGVATRALKQLLQEITHRPLFARAVKDNIGSVKVLEKCGFKIVADNKDFAAGRGEEVEDYVFRLDSGVSN